MGCGSRAAPELELELEPVLTPHQCWEIIFISLSPPALLGSRETTAATPSCSPNDHRLHKIEIKCGVARKY